MLPARPVLPQRSGVLRGDVTLVLGEAVRREHPVQLHHDPVPGDLGEHAGRRHTRRDPVTLPHRQAGHAQAVHAEAVGQHVLRARGEGGERPTHRRQVAHVQPSGVDLVGRDDHHGVRQCPVHHLRVHPFPARRGEQLRVGQPLDLAAPPLGQHRRGGDQRTGTRAPARLVRAGDVPEAAPLERSLQGVQAGLAAHDGARRGQHDASPWPAPVDCPSRVSRTGSSGDRTAHRSPPTRREATSGDQRCCAARRR